MTDGIKEEFVTEGDIGFVFYPRRRDGRVCEALGRAEAVRAMNFHKTVPGYNKTPLVSLPGLASKLHVAEFMVKDESKRFGLGAFKALGCSYAMGREIAERLGLSPEDLSYEALSGQNAREKLGPLTFVAATDGNHGNGVAWMAKLLGHRAVIYLPRGSSTERLERIRKNGAKAEITELPYDDTVRLARREADENGWITIQDTAWTGYEKIPLLIMKGYTTIALEIDEEISRPPTHIFLQAGVGSFSAAILGYYAAVYGDERPVTVIVEPNRADCVFMTAKAADGALHSVSGDMDTIMAGLACGEPNPMAWDVLSGLADAFVSCPDRVSEYGMRMLGNPVFDKTRIVSGESGAVTAGLAALLMEPGYERIRSKLGINGDSRILCISTEGATDMESYRSIVWGPL